MPFEQLPSAFKDWFSDSIKFSLLVAHLRQIEYCKLGAVTQRKLIENAADIIADGSLTQKQFVCNLTVAFPTPTRAIISCSLSPMS